MLGTAEMNLLREFLPEIRRKFSKYEPKRLQKLEQSPRVQKIEQMMLGPVALPPCPTEKNPPGKTGSN